MLETILEYALEQLDRLPDADGFRARHAAFYVKFAADAAQGMRGRSAWSWLDRVEQELPNIRVALEFWLQHGEPAAALRASIDLNRFWAVRDTREGRAWLERALETRAGTTAERARASYCAAPHAYFRGDVEWAIELLHQAAGLANEAGDDGTQACALGFLAMVLVEQGDYRGARRTMRRCTKLASTLDDLWDRADALRPMATVHAMQENYDLADTLNREVLEVERQLDDEWGVAAVLTTVGYVAMLRGADDEARSAFEEGLDIAQRMRDTYRIPVLLGNLGLVAVVQGRYNDALILLGECLERTNSRGERRTGSEAVLGLAAAHAALGNLELAVKLETISKAVADALELIFATALLERLEPHLDAAREHADPTILAAFVRQTPLTLETAIAELENARGTNVSTP
jgi:tetratricopeptide (TPR) repeat protein